MRKGCTYTVAGVGGDTRGVGCRVDRRACRVTGFRQPGCCGAVRLLLLRRTTGSTFRHQTTRGAFTRAWVRSPAERCRAATNATTFKRALSALRLTESIYFLLAEVANVLRVDVHYVVHNTIPKQLAISCLTSCTGYGLLRLREINSEPPTRQAPSRTLEWRSIGQNQGVHLATKPTCGQQNGRTARKTAVRPVVAAKLRRTKVPKDLKKLQSAHRKFVQRLDSLENLCQRNMSSNVYVLTCAVPFIGLSSSCRSPCDRRHEGSLQRLRGQCSCYDVMLGRHSSCLTSGDLDPGQRRARSLD